MYSFSIVLIWNFINYFPFLGMLILGFFVLKILSIFKIALISKTLKVVSGALLFNYHVRFFLEKSLDMLISAFKSFSLL